MREITCETMGRNLVIHLPEELDHHSSRHLEEMTAPYLAGGQVKRLVFDYSGTHFMDSAGVGAVLSAYKKIRDREGEIVIYGAGPRVRRLLEMAGIFRLAVICGTAEEALTKQEQSQEERK